ncbi:MAG: hypothetical protein AAGF11_00530 [Myxococcota bacterium]
MAEVSAGSPDGSPAAPVAGPEQNSSQLLRQGEQLEQAGDYAGAGRAYRKAFEALSEQKQRANEGARATVLSSSAYWSAFEADEELDPQSLEDGLAVLELWLGGTGADSTASLLPVVERKATRLREVRDPLVAAEQALAQKDLQAAADRYAEVLEALERQRRDEAVRVRVALRLASLRLKAYGEQVKGYDDIEPNLAKLEGARDVLRRYEIESSAATVEPPPTDEDTSSASESKESIKPAAATHGEDLQALLDDAEERLAEAEQTLEQGPPPEVEPKKKRRRRRRKPPTTDAPEGPSRVVPIVLLSVGVAATGAGAALIAEPVAFGREADRDIRDARVQADQTQDDVPGFDYDGYASVVDDYEQQASRRNISMIVGGSALAAGGIAMSVVGIVKLVKGRRGEAKSAQRAQLVPTLSRSRVGLSLSTRF